SPIPCLTWGFVVLQLAARSPWTQRGTTMAGLDRFLRLSLQSGASDLHMTLGREPSGRINGTLRKIKMPALSPQENEAILVEILNPEQRKILDAKKSVDFCYDVPSLGRFRANVFRQRLGMCGVFRTLPHKVPTLAELNMPPVIEKIL